MRIPPLKEAHPVPPTTMLHSRRRLLVASAIAPFLSQTPARGEIASAAALAVAASVVSIVAGISGMVSDADMRRQLRRVSNQLSVVIAQQDVIIAELRAMKLLIVEAAYLAWKGAYQRRLSSFDRQLQILITAYEAANFKLTPRLKDDLEELSRECTLTTLDIGQMDVWAFTSYASGVATVLLADAMLRTPKARIAATKSQFAAAINRWTDASHDDSLPAINETTNKEIQLRLKKLAERPRSYVVYDGWEVNDDGGLLCRRRTKTTLTVTGQFEQGFSGSLSSSSDRVWKCEDRFPRTPNDVDVSIGLIELMNAGRAQTGMAPFAVGGGDPAASIPLVPGFEPTGQAIVDDFNRERVAIYELMAASAKQKLLATQMSIFFDALK